jgi:uncharacterized repeat protein (TIGR02543 family)
MDWNGTILQQISTRFGEKTPAFEGTLPTREGYSLNEANLWIPALAETVESATVIYQLNWVKQHIVTFDSDGGSEVEAQQVDDGALATRPADPTKEGYTFLGWFDDNNEFNFETKKIYEDYTLKAHWKINQYTVTFMDGDTVLQKTTADYGTAITAPENPTKEGYIFKGWDIDVPATIPAGDLTITAQWALAVAMIGETPYETLADAVTAAVEGDTILMVANTTESVVIPAEKNFVLDLNGKTVTGTDAAPAITNNCTLTIQDTSANADGKIDGGSKSAVRNAGTFTMTSGVLYATASSMNNAVFFMEAGEASFT